MIMTNYIQNKDSMFTQFGNWFRNVYENYSSFSSVVKLDSLWCPCGLERNVYSLYYMQCRANLILSRPVPIHAL